MERPGTGLDALSGARRATTEYGRVLPQRRHLLSHSRADCPFLAVLGTSADKTQPGLAASFSRRWPQHGHPRKATNVGVALAELPWELRGHRTQRIIYFI